MPKDADSIRFEELLGTLYRFLNVKDRPEQHSVFYGRLAGIYDEEYDRYKRLMDAV